MRAASAPRIHRYTYGQYLEHESSSNVKHEFIDGDIYAMAGGTIEHAIISMNVGSALNAQLRGASCVVASSDLKVRVSATDLTTYPDVTVICGPVQRDPQSPDVALNPSLVVEVLSKSTEDWDRGEKLENYKQIPSLLACVLISYRQQRVEVVRRGPDGAWTTEEAGPGESVSLPVSGCMLAVDDVYRNVDIPT
jgi:Uma2 family endonuclease